MVDGGCQSRWASPRNYWPTLDLGGMNGNLSCVLSLPRRHGQSLIDCSGILRNRIIPEAMTTSRGPPKRRRRRSLVRRCHRRRPLESGGRKGMKLTLWSPAADAQNSEGDESGRQKKSRLSATRVPGGAESTKRARHSPVTGTQKAINGKSKTAGRRAGRLAPTTSAGSFRQSLPGHSVSQGWVGAS